MNELNSFKISPLLYGQFAITDKTIYVSARNYNGLFAIDIISGRLAFMGKFLHQGSYDTSLFYIKNYGKKLIFIPSCAHEIAVFDIEKKQIKEISLKQVLSTYSIVMSTAVIYEDNLYLFPAQANSIIIYSMKNECILDVINTAEIYKNVFREGYTALGSTDSNYIYGNKIYIPCWTQSAFMSLDMDNKNVEFHRIAECTQGFCALCGYGDIIYALNRNKELIEWDIKSKKVISRTTVLEDGNTAEHYRVITVISGDIYLLSHIGILRIIKIDLGTKSVHKGLSQKLSDILEKECINETVYFGKINEEKIYCYTDKNRYLCIDLKNEKLDWNRDVIFDPDELKKIIFNETDMLEKRNIINETNAIAIKELVEMICNFQKKEEGKESHIGKQIYKAS